MIRTPKFLLTHPGRGHTDDLLTTAVLLSHFAEQPACVMRRDPSAADLQDTHIIVYDVGYEHTPDFGNFDHHQFSASETRCALSLVLEELGLREKALLYWPWLNATEIMDTQGPKGVGKFLQIDYPSQGQPLASPVEGIILEWWSSQTQINPGDPLHNLLTKIGKDLLGSIQEIENRLVLLRKTVEVFDFSRFQGAFINIPREENPSRFISHFWKEIGIEPLASISPDERGKGTSFFSRDPEILNFSKFKEDPRTKFVTSNGRLAKTHLPVSREESLEFIKAALV